jgi:hypothetical protein
VREILLKILSDRYLCRLCSGPDGIDFEKFTAILHKFVFTLKETVYASIREQLLNRAESVDIVSLANAPCDEWIGIVTRGKREGDIS